LLSPQLPRAADRLRAARHAHAVRSRAARLPREAREADVILRIAAAVALIAGFGALAAYLHMMGRLPTSSAAEKHLRRMKDRVAQPAAAAPTSYDAIAALPKSRPLPEYAPLERAAVSLEGYVQSVVRAPPGDPHRSVERFAPRVRGVPALSRPARGTRAGHRPARSRRGRPR